MNILFEEWSDEIRIHCNEHNLNFEKLESDAAAQKIAILNAKGVKTDEKNT